VIGRDIMIGLSPTCLRVALVAGREILNVNCTMLEPGKWEQTWSERLGPLDAPLRAALECLSVRSGAARVVYVGPKAGAEMFNLPALGPGALRAAELSLREASADKSQAGPMAVHQMLRDKASAGTEGARTHVLGVSDSAAGSNAIAAWLARGGLSVQGLIPSKAAALALVIREAASLPETGSHAVLWLDDHFTALAGWHNGRLVFARAIDFGYWMLADAAYRAARAQGHTGFDRRQSYQLLFRSGIPRRGQTVDTAMRLAAEHVLPFMQPVLQRYVIETKQTLRFGIPESELARTTLRLRGPGGVIPELATALEPQLDITIEPAQARAPGDAAVERGELTGAAALDASGFTLLPPVEADRRMANRLNAALRVGAVAAAAGLAALVGWAYARTSSTTRQLTALETRTEAMSQHGVLRDRADKLAADLGSATRTVGEMLGNRPRWMAALAMASKACGDSVELNHIKGEFPSEAGGAPVLQLSGTAWPSYQNPRADTLSAFLDRLAGSPLVAAAKIVSAHADMNGTDAKTFVISVQLKTVGPEGTLAEAFGRSRDARNSTAQAQEPSP
jgi:hypothetical protein